MSGATPAEPGWITLASTELSAAIDPLGAQLSTLRDRTGRDRADADLLWNGDPSVWSGRAPLLFPIVGTLAGGSYRLGSQRYRLPRHGFARGRRFQVIDSSADSALFRLTADETTLPVYPFHFDLSVRFTVDGPNLSVTASVRNTGDGYLAASFGYHPAFAWPLPSGAERSAHYVEFECDEAAPIRRLNADGLLTTVLHPTPVEGRRLRLTDALFQQDVMIFDRLRSRSLTYGAARGPRIRVSYPDSPLLGIWAKPGANFVCIEPWHGVADVEDFDGDFTDKAGVFTLQSRETLSTTMVISVVGGSTAA